MPYTNTSISQPPQPIINLVDDQTDDGALHLAIRADRTEEALRLIEEGESLYQPNAYGVTPLHLICALNRCDLLEHFIQDQAAQYASLKWYQRLTRRTTIDLTDADDDGNTPLHYAATQPTARLLEIFFASKHAGITVLADLASQNHVKRTALHFAAAHPKKAGLELLLKLPGVSKEVLKCQDQWGMTALHFSTMALRIENARLLISAGVDLDIKAYPNELGALLPQKLPQLLTPFWLALELFDEEILDLFLGWVDVDDGLQLLQQTKNSEGLTAIHIASFLGKKAPLQKWIKSYSAKAILNVLDDNGRKAIHSAAQGGQLEIIEFLLAQGTSLTTQDKQGDQPLHVAAVHGQTSVVKLICNQSQVRNTGALEHKIVQWRAYLGHKAPRIDLGAKNRLNQSAYRLARLHHQNEVMNTLREYQGHDNFDLAQQYIEQDDVENLSRIIREHPVLIHEADEKQHYLLHHVVLSQSMHFKDLAEILLNAGAKVDAVNGEGQTALHLASALISDIDVHRLLIDNGANVKSTDHKGLTPLHQAAGNNNVAAIHYLILMGAYIEHVSQDGLTPIFFAILGQHIAAFNALVDYKANLELVAYPSFLSRMTNVTPLWLALDLGCDPILKKIVTLPSREFINFDISTSTGSTILHYFATTGDVAYYKMAAALVYDPYPVDNEGFTPLHRASQNGHLAVIQYIVEEVAVKQGRFSRSMYGGFDINAQTDDGRSAWLIAKQNKQQAVMDYLVAKRANTLEDQIITQSLIEKSDDFVQRQREFSQELEQTAVYQYLNSGRMFFAPLFNFYGGPISMGLQFLQQLAWYAPPVMQSTAQAWYYKLKPLVHNYAPEYVEQGLDITASLSSVTYSLGFKGMRALDYLAHPTSRLAGLTASYLLANLAWYYTDNKSVQALMLFLGREAGMIGVDAYQGGKHVTNNELKQSLNIWRSLIGNEKGEYFVHSMHSLVQFRNALYATLGQSEHRGVDVLTQFSSYQKLASTLQTLTHLFMPYQGYFSTPVMLFSKVQKMQRSISNLRDEVIHDIEKWIYNNALPEGDYRNYASIYLLQTHSQLLQHQILEAQRECEEAENASQAQQAGAKQRLTAALAALQDDEKQMQVLWDKAPQAIKGKALQLAQKNTYEARLARDEAQTRLDFLKKYNKAEQEQREVENTLKDAEDKLKAHSDKLVNVENELMAVMNSLEKEEYEKSEIERKNTTDKAVASYKEHAFDLLDKHELFSQAQLESFKAKEELNKQNQKVEVLKLQTERFDKQLAAIGSLKNLVIHKIADDAMRIHGKNKPAVAMYIIDKIVDTGAIDKTEAIKRMFEQLKSAQEGKYWYVGHDSLEDRTADQVKALSGDYKKVIKGDRDKLNKQLEIAKQDCLKAQQTYDRAESTVQTTKNAFVNLLAPEAQKEFSIQYQQHQEANEALDWHAVHSNENTKQTLIFLGQPALTKEIALHTNKGNKVFAYQDIGRSLVNYKYLFVPMTNANERMTETIVLSNVLNNSPLTEEAISHAKNGIDNEIAQLLMDNATQAAVALLGSKEHPDYPKKVASNITSNLQRGFSIHPDAPLAEVKLENQSLEAVIVKTVSENNPLIARDAISRSLRENTQAISVDEIAKIEASAAAAPAPTQTPKKQNKKKHGFKHLLEKVGEKGVAISTNGSNLAMGLNNENMYPIFDANPKTAPLFTLPQKQLPVAAVSKPITPEVTTIPLLASFNPFSSVLPNAVLGAKAPESIKPAPKISPKVSAPILPLSTFTPSLAPQVVSVPRAMPTVARIPMAGVRRGVPLAVAPTKVSERRSAPHSVIPLSQGSRGVPPRVEPRRGNYATELVIGLLNLLIPPAHANPIAISQFAMHQLAAAGGMLGRSAERREESMTIAEQRWDQYNHPVHQPDDTPYFGEDPNEDEEKRWTPHTFPPTSDTTSKTETLVEQPGFRNFLTTFPKVLLFSSFPTVYFRKHDEESSSPNNNIASKVERKYQHDYPKHKPNSKGTAAQWRGASLNPIPDEEIGQKLLDEAYFIPEDSSKGFNYYEGRIIKFQSSRDGKWHSYEIEEEVRKNAGHDILKAFLKDNLISKSEYKRLLKK